MGDVETRCADGNADRGVRGVERKGQNGWRRWLQESKLEDFEFQSIKLLAFRRAVDAAAAAIVCSSSSPLLLYLCLLSVFFSLAPFPSFSPSPPSSRPLFSPYPLCLPPRTVALRLKYIPMYPPTPSRTPHSSFSSFLPWRFHPFPFLFPPLCRGSSFATHESARIRTRVRPRAFSGRSRIHAEYSAP